MVYHPPATVNVARIMCFTQHTHFYASLDSMIANKKDNKVLMIRASHDEIVAVLTSVPKLGKTTKQIHEEGLSNYFN